MITSEKILPNKNVPLVTSHVKVDVMTVLLPLVKAVMIDTG